MNRSEGHCYRFKSLRISAIGLKFCGVMHNMMKQIAIKMAMLGQCLPALGMMHNFENMLGPGPRDDVTALTP